MKTTNPPNNYKSITILNKICHDEELQLHTGNQIWNKTNDSLSLSLPLPPKSYVEICSRHNWDVIANVACHLRARHGASTSSHRQRRILWTTNCATWIGRQPSVGCIWVEDAVPFWQRQFTETDRLSHFCRTRVVIAPQQWNIVLGYINSHIFT